MENNTQETYYNRRIWLNENISPSTGSIVCYHGVAKYPEDKEPFENMFIEISDCHVKARLHKTQFENKNQFIGKLRELRLEITRFIDHLEKEQ